jgi:membrane protein
MTNGQHESRTARSAETAAKAGAKSSAEAALSRLPPRLRQALAWLLSRWPGRVLIATAATFRRIEIFDRSMTIAAQFFTSVFPILILLATWAGEREANRLADEVDLPAETQSVLQDALQGADAAAFGLVGVLFVLGSATSLSRALTRSFATIWEMSRPKTNLGSAWRWLAAVMVLALSLIVVRSLSDSIERIPPRQAWPIALSFSFDIIVAVFVPWVLLAGGVRVRSLVPGGLVFALVMEVVRPASAAWLPRALESSAERYGSIGVAFTYLAGLYVMSLCFLGAAVIGQAITSDPGGLGRWIRRDDQAREPALTQAE